MKTYYLFVGLVAMLLASCSTDERLSDSRFDGRKVTLNATLPNSGTRVTEAGDATYGLITTWSSDDNLDVLVNTNMVVPMTKSTGNMFTATPGDETVASGFEAGKTIYGVNNTSTDNITTALNGSQLKATVNFTNQKGTVDNLKKYDLMYGTGDPTGSITFNHKVCMFRLDINSDSLKADGITSITGMKLKYVATSGTPLFASQEVYNFGASCDSTITSSDTLSLNNTNITVANGIATVYIAVPNRQNLYGALSMRLNCSTGTKNRIYDLTKAISMSNARMKMSTVHPMAITSLHRIPNIGDYLFNNGKFGDLSEKGTATPIAVIFSNTTSATDQTHNWTHGYAIALKPASQSSQWGPSGTNPTTVLITTTAALIADKDGYTHTKYINSSTYPAAYVAATTYKSTVPAPGSTSGWYLPSSGQWFDVCVNLGKMSATNYQDNAYYLVWPEATAQTCTNNLNAYLTPLASGTYTTFPWDGTLSRVYWCSSENGVNGVRVAAFNVDGPKSMSMGVYSKDWALSVRAVLAF